MIAEKGQFEISTVSGVYYNEFFEDDLDALMDQPYAWNLVLRPATCLNPDCSIATSVHTVAVAIKYDRSLITTKAALPCPPDCPVKVAPPSGRYGTISFDEYVVITYMISPAWLEWLLSMIGIKMTRSKRIRKS